MEKYVEFFKKYLTYFLVFAILGFIAENIAAYINDWNYNSGFMHGPWTPVYGFGILTTLLINHLVKIKRGILRFVVLFLSLSFFITIVEILGGLFIENVFDTIFWGYGHHQFSIGQYASLEMMLLWGSATTLFAYFCIEKCNRVIDKIPFPLTLTIGIVMLSDFIYTMIVGL